MTKQEQEFADAVWGAAEIFIGDCLVYGRNYREGCKGRSCHLIEQRLRLPEVESDEEFFKLVERIFQLREHLRYDVDR